MRSARLDQDHADLGRVNLAEIVAHDEAAQFLGRARQLHAGRPAADDDNGHQLLQLLGIVGQLGLLEGEQDFAADAQRVVDRLEAGARSPPTLDDRSSW